MNQTQQASIWRSSINWFSKVKNIIWKSQTQQDINANSHPYILSHISKKSKAQARQTILMKLRKPSSQTGFKTRTKRIKNYLSKNTHFEKPSQLCCPICLDMFVKPIITTCGHTFCFQCLDEALLFNPVCPVCRTVIRGLQLTICKSFDQIVKRFISKYDDKVYSLNYHQRCQQFQQWYEDRTVKKQLISINKKLDIRDTEAIWCRAIVRQIYMNKNQPTSILVHYLGWNNVYDEIIDLDCQRIANYQFYSSRPDIPHYQINHEDQQNMHSYVIIGQPYIPNIQRIHPLYDFSLENMNTFPIIPDNIIEQNTSEQFHEQQEQQIQNIPLDVMIPRPLSIDYRILNSSQSLQQSEIEQDQASYQLENQDQKVKKQIESKQSQAYRQKLKLEINPEQQSEKNTLHDQQFKILQNDNQNSLLDLFFQLSQQNNMQRNNQIPKAKDYTFQSSKIYLEINNKCHQLIDNCDLFKQSQSQQPNNTQNLEKTITDI